jgi:hypothetical protein
MLGFELTFWDYLTFAAIFAVGIGLVVFFVFLAGLPGRIAIAREHPEAEAVMLMGWAGFLPVVPWIQAFIWAFKPTDVVDIRRFPGEERRATAAELARLSGKPAPAEAKEPQAAKPAPEGDQRG